MLALTPESASSIMVIGRSRDLGMCTVRKQDGKVCGSWCDKCVSDVCDYHVQNAVQVMTGFYAVKKRNFYYSLLGDYSYSKF